MMIVSSTRFKKTIHIEFPFSRDYIFLNHAAVSPWPKRTAQAISTFADENVLTGPVFYPRWQAVEQQLRIQLAELINAPSADDIALLKNTSEGLSVIAYGIDWQQGDNIVISNQEFPSNRIVWESLRGQGVQLREAEIESDQHSPEDALEAICDQRTRLLSISSVQYASGISLDLERLGRFCRDREILFCVDAIQSLGVLQMDVQAINADFVIADGHKWLMSPEGLALFFCREDRREQLRLHQFGWRMIENPTDFDQRDWIPCKTGQRFECGSPNMLGIHGMSASIGLLLELGLDQIEQHTCANGDYLVHQLKGLKGINIRSENNRRGGIVAFQHETIATEVLYERLQQHNIICAIRAGAIRFAAHFYTNKSQMDHALEIVEGSLSG